MNTKKQLTIAWTIAGILAVLLLIALYFVLNPKKDLGTVLQEGQQDITAQRDKIRADCNSTDLDKKAACAADLQDLSDILREFSKDVAHATSTAPTAQ